MGVSGAAKSRGRRAVRVLVRVAGVGAMVLVVGYVGARWAVRAAVEGALSKAGVSGAEFSVREVGLRRVVLGDLRVRPVGEGTGVVGGVEQDLPRVAELVAEFSPWEVLGGKVDRVRISGASAVVEVGEDGAVRVVGLPPPAATPPAGSGGAGKLRPADLPGVIEVGVSTLRVRMGEGGTREVSLVVEGAHRTLGDGRSTCRTTVWVGADRAEFLASGTPEGGWFVEGTGVLSLGDVKGLMPEGWWPAGVSVDGRAKVRVSGDSGTGVVSAAVDVEEGKAWVDVGGERVLVRGASVEGKVRKSPAAGMSGGVKVSGLVENRWLGGEGRLVGEVSLNGERVEGTLAVQGPGGTVRVSEASVSLRGEGRAKVELVAALPGEVRELLRGAGMEVEGFRPLVAGGSVTLAGGSVVAELSGVATGAGAVRVGDAAVNDVMVTAGKVMLDGSLNVGGNGAAGWNLSVEGVRVRAAGVEVPGVEVTRGGAVVLEAPVVSGRLRGTAWEVGWPEALVKAEEGDVGVEGVGQLRGVGGVWRVTGMVSGEELTVRWKDRGTIGWESAEGADGSWRAGRGGLVLLPTPKPAEQGGASDLGDEMAVLPLVSWRKGQAVRVGVRAVGEALAGEAGGARVSAGRVIADARWSGVGRAVEDERSAGAGERAGADGAGSVPDREAATRATALGAEAAPSAGGVSRGGGLEKGDGWGAGLEGAVTVFGGEVEHPAAGVAVRGVEVSWPVALGVEVPKEGRLKAARVERNGATLPGLEAALYVTRERVWADVTWPLVSEGVVKGSAELWLLGKQTSANVTAWVPAFEFTKADELRKLLPAAVADADVAGRFEGRVQYAIGGGKVTQWGYVQVADASLRSKALDAELAGVSGLVTVRSFSPLVSDPGQKVSVKSARLGKVEVRDGAVGFRLDEGGIVFVEDAEFSLAGGTVSARGFRVQPSRGAADLVVYADGIEVGAVAGLASGGKVGGEGRLFARLPASVKWPEFVRLEDGGYVHAEASGRPGGEAGVLRLGLYAEDVAKMVGGNAGGSSAQTTALLQERVRTTLGEFGFSALTLGISRTEARGLTAQLRVAGRGPGGEKGAWGGQALDLTVNVTGLEDAINAGLMIKRAGE